MRDLDPKLGRERLVRMEAVIRAILDSTELSMAVREELAGVLLMVRCHPNFSPLSQLVSFELEPPRRRLRLPEPPRLLAAA